jgi:glycosyltransferase involved in cell wall biosynthesis
VRVVRSPASRGVQLNAGAAAARGDVLLFLHADCRLPPDAPSLILERLRQEGVAGGAFHVRFAENGHPTLPLVAAGINLRTRLARTATGDQAIFVRRAVWERVGRFPEWPLFEDVEFVRRIRCEGRFSPITTPITISARRHLRRGIIRTVLRVYLLRAGFFLGVSPHTLERFF